MSEGLPEAECIECERRFRFDPRWKDALTCPKCGGRLLPDGEVEGE